MLLFSRLLRLGLVGVSLVVLSGIVPISLAHFHTGDACPSLGLVPACYIVSVAYAAMAIGALLWERPLAWLFYAGVTSVVLLAVSGTSLELLGKPTCPRSDTGWPLCYTSLFVGMSMAATFLVARLAETRAALKNA